MNQFLNDFKIWTSSTVQYRLFQNSHSAKHVLYCWCAELSADCRQSMTSISPRPACARTCYALLYPDHSIHYLADDLPQVGKLLYHHAACCWLGLSFPPIMFKRAFLLTVVKTVKPYFLELKLQRFLLLNVLCIVGRDAASSHFPRWFKQGLLKSAGT